MKKTLLIFSFILANYGISQVSDNSVCKQYVYKINTLKAQLGINTVNPEVIVSSFDNKVDFKIISCKGTRISDEVSEVRIDFVVINRRDDIKRVSIGDSNSVAFDIYGNEYKSISSSFTNKQIFPGIATNGFIIFGNVKTNTKMLRFINMPFYNNDIIGGNFVKSRVRIKNLKIEWDKEKHKLSKLQQQK